MTTQAYQQGYIDAIVKLAADDQTALALRDTIREHQRGNAPLNTLYGGAVGGVTGASIGAGLRTPKTGKGALIGAGLGAGLGGLLSLIRASEGTGRSIEHNFDESLREEDIDPRSNPEAARELLGKQMRRGSNTLTGVNALTGGGIGALTGRALSGGSRKATLLGALLGGTGNALAHRAAIGNSPDKIIDTYMANQQ